MVTTDKVNVGESSTGTSTSTTYYAHTKPKAEQGWECPRCGRINAPWVRQCDCPNNWSPPTITWTGPDKDSHDWWWSHVTCEQADARNYTTAHNPIVGGSDYKDSATGTWVNVPGTYTNSVKE